MSATDIIKKLQSQKSRDRFQQAGIQHLRLFGSGARDELTQESDIDLIYDFDPKYIQDDRGVRGLYTELSEQLGYPIELVHKKNIDPALQSEVFSSMLSVF